MSPPQVDFLTYVGDALTLGKPMSAAIMGTSSQVMAVYVSALELIEPLLGSQTSVDEIAATIVEQTYKTVNATWATTGDGSAALSDAAKLSDLYCSAYEAAMPNARRRMMRRLHSQWSHSPEDLKPLCDSVGRVSHLRMGGRADSRAQAMPSSKHAHLDLHACSWEVVAALCTFRLYD